MDFAGLLNASSAGIVLGGTLLATWLRSGRGDCKLALVAALGVFRRRFDPELARGQVARQIRAIEDDGILRAEACAFSDPDLQELAEHLIATRLVSSVKEREVAQASRRSASNLRVMNALSQATEVAPVFGLAGTLISLGQLPADGIDPHAYMGAIAMAVSATLYGLMLANLLLAPLARAVERAAAHEEAARSAIVEWMVQRAEQLLERRPPSLAKAA